MLKKKEIMLFCTVPLMPQCTLSFKIQDIHDFHSSRTQLYRI